MFSYFALRCKTRWQTKWRAMPDLHAQLLGLTFAAMLSQAQFFQQRTDFRAGRLP